MLYPLNWGGYGYANIISIKNTRADALANLFFPFRFNLGAKQNPNEFHKKEKLLY